MFEIYQSRDNNFRWRLKARNGEIVATSEGYTTRSAAHQSAEKVALWANGSRIIDL